MRFESGPLWAERLPNQNYNAGCEMHSVVITEVNRNQALQGLRDHVEDKHPGIDPATLQPWTLVDFIRERWDA
jgi:hypothetical protein